MKDVNIAAMESAVDIATKESEAKLQSVLSEVEAAKDDARTLGALQMLNYQQAHNELIRYSLFYQARETKEYKKEGMTFEKFCEAAGENVRNVNRILKDLRSIYDQFQDKLSCFVNVPFNKIKYLGKSFQDNLSRNENGDLVLGDDHIPLSIDNKDEIEAAIDAFIESHKQEKKTLEKKLARATKETDKIVDEATKGLTVERDALIKEVDRLKHLDPEDRDIEWSEAHLKEMTGLCVEFEKLVRSMAMDKRLHDDIHTQAKCESMINLMTRACRDLQRDWDDEFNPYEDE